MGRKYHIFPPMSFYFKCRSTNCIVCLWIIHVSNFTLPPILIATWNRISVAEEKLGSEIWWKIIWLGACCWGKKYLIQNIFLEPNAKLSVLSVTHQAYLQMIPNQTQKCLGFGYRLLFANNRKTIESERRHHSYMWPLFFFRIRVLCFCSHLSFCFSFTFHNF